MTELMRALYNFTEEQNLEKSFLDREYNKYRASAYQRFEKITTEYPQLLGSLDDLVSDLNVCCGYEQEAAFQMGFLLRGELSRIQKGYSSLFL